MQIWNWNVWILCAVRVYYTWRFRIIFMRCRRFVELKPIRMQSGRNVRMSITDLLCAIFWEGAHNQSLLQPPARLVVMQSILWFRGFARFELLMFSNAREFTRKTIEYKRLGEWIFFVKHFYDISTHFFFNCSNSTRSLKNCFKFKYSP